MADKKDLRVIKTKINIESTFLRLLKETTFEQCFNCDQSNKHDVIVAKSY